MNWLSGAITIGTFAVLYYFEKRRLLRRQIYDKELETARNLAIGATTGAVLYALEKPVTDKLTRFVEEKRVGLLKLFRLPPVLESVAAVALLDYTLYLWHVLTHKAPFLWNFHRVHHADLDLQASTAVRFHFGEMTISVAFRAGQILLIGVNRRNLQIWQTLLFLSIFFHHSNVRLPKYLEERLEKIIMTPRLHGIHHSMDEAEMNSNWSSGLTAWDRLHKTFRSDVSQSEIKIGVRGFDSPRETTLREMLLAPFLQSEKSAGMKTFETGR